MVTKKILRALPEIEPARMLLQSLAMLDATMTPDWESRYYSFDSRWGQGEMMASMRNGSGDSYFILFNEHGAAIKGFTHESPMSPYAQESGKVWPGVLDSIPNDFEDFLAEPAFSMEDTTFCIWRKYSDKSWQAGEIEYPGVPDPDGAEELLSILDGMPSTYRRFAEEYYESALSLTAVKYFYEHKPLTKDAVKALNPDRSMRGLVKEAEEIGYPLA